MPGLAPRNTDECPILRPSKAQFNKPFLTFVSDYFKKHPEVPVIKVVPPKGYTPRQSVYDLDDTVIEVPIEQRVRRTCRTRLSRRQRLFSAASSAGAYARQQAWVLRLRVTVSTGTR